MQTRQTNGKILATVEEGFLRDPAQWDGEVTAGRAAFKHRGQGLGRQAATRKYLYWLFPYVYGQQACKIAGMRKPRKLMLDV